MSEPKSKTDTKTGTKAGSETRVLLGSFANAHGIRGEVQVRTFTGAPEAIATYGPLSDKEGRRTFKLKVVRVTDKGIIARVEGVADRNAAETLKGIELYVERAQLPAASEGEYYHADLIGLRAVSSDGEEIGKIIAVANFGASDLLEIQLAGGTATEFVPFSDACVPSVDIAAGVATIVMPEMVGEPEPEGGET
jgi:16S rRNA processing protein RimM